MESKIGFAEAKEFFVIHKSEENTEDLANEIWERMSFTEKKEIKDQLKETQN